MKPHGFREHCPGTDVSILPTTTGLQSCNETNHLKHKVKTLSALPCSEKN